MKVAVTGGSGELGTLVLRRLLDDRSVKAVVSLDRRPPLVASGKLVSVIADVREPGFERHLEGCEAVFHFAFLVTTHAPRAVFDAVNVEGSKNVFRAAVAVGAKTIVYSSSVAAYGVAPGHAAPFVEDSPRVFVPGFAYSANKFQVEEFLDGFEKEHEDVAIARLRPVVLVGRRMEHALGAALRKRVVPSLGSNPLPVVWDEDVADAAILAWKKRARGAFNLSADDALSAEALARAAGMTVRRVPLALARGVARLSPLLARLGIADAVDPSWLDHTDAPMVASSEKAKRELGWKPRCPTAASVVQRFDEVVPWKVDRRIRLFLFLTSLVAKDKTGSNELSGFDSRIHLCLTGRGGGDFTIALKDRRMTIGPGTPRPPTASVTLSAALLLDLLAGKTDLMASQMTGKIRFDGEGHCALVFGGMITAFRVGAAAGGARGRLARAVARWFGRGEKAKA
jgi:nucleoside-diphosphate-sugar epimerase/putative sterol carrier protein